MKNYNKLFAVFFIFIISILTTNIFAQQIDSTTHKNMNPNKTMDNKHMKMMDSTHMKKMMDSSHMKMDTTHMKLMKDKQKKNKMKDIKSSIIREGEIDLISIDKNKNGKVYQDMMDWNVISDNPGECPVCGMKLKEVTIENAKKNLTDHKHKVKE